MAKVVHRYRKRVDVILGSWAYPDGFAAVMLSRLLGVPAVIKLHGSDINVLAHMAGPRRGLRWALPRAERIVAVSHPLREAAIELGATSARIDVVRNGVDRACFHPKDRLAARRALGLPVDRAMVLCVSNVERHKGSLDLVRAMAVLAARRPDVSLVMVGDGTAMDECKRLSAELNVGISFVGARPHQEVSDWLTACDVFVLPSWNEGTPNVLLEALACGRRVVATRIGGIPDVVRSNTLGTLVTPADPAALAVAIEDALSTPYDPTVISTTLDVPDWRGSALRLHASLTAAVESYGHRAAA
ncbi:MAG TPA: glycosyltransferase family 4 protein, partial [Polyangiaceae bacterium]|nr:glycosyltransferase family 4 protein [Polyangiaceae bacterium]